MKYKLANDIKMLDASTREEQQLIQDIDKILNEIIDTDIASVIADDKSLYDFVNDVL